MGRMRGCEAASFMPEYFTGGQADWWSKANRHVGAGVVKSHSVIVYYHSVVVS